ncbi:hypothetical protein OV079_45510 [Nannocystis pusilla]|uniref:Uncharacterized protein n=1 Tax=Nannocystis pusilla TaxID=889268 RepID=A0A9X3J3C4_9BACT|nr:hypothetical protein [Nannocystis pusilla]MCY1012674.1 hypothetical protein [Nannocystis pusilla]
MSPETGDNLTGSTGAEESPTTGAEETLTTGATGETTGSWSAGAAFVAPQTSEDGCACDSRAGGAWWLAALGLARRRRRARGGCLNGHA